MKFVKLLLEELCKLNGKVKYVKFSKVFALMILILLLPGVIAPPPKAGCPIQANTNIVVYGDTGFGGVGALSKSWMAHFLDWWKSYDSSINYIFLDRNDVRSDCNLANFPNVKLYIQPGGNAYYQQNALGSSGKNNILNYLDNANGAYLGVCAGAFYAANDYFWQGTFYNWQNLLGRFPTVEGSITTIADYDGNPGYALTGIDSQDKLFNMIYYGGPTRGWRNTPPEHPGQKLLSFTSIPSELPAAIKNGKMLLMSVHAEAFENDGIQGLSTADRIENYKWLANSVNDVAGTSFYVPPYAQPPQCSDGIDNDLDGFIDYPADIGCASGQDNDETDPVPPAPTQCNDGLDNDLDGFIDYPADVGCVSLDDNDETNPTGPAELFFDDFEDSDLAGWTPSSIENNWYNGNSNPYNGARHAEAQPRNTNDPASIIEKTINTIGYSNIGFNYYRRLVGLDIADEFKAKWFDGSSWQILEQTGSSSANDANYIYKAFALPANAANNPNFKIRFECTAGAVSEFCRVDDVKVQAN